MFIRESVLRAWAATEPEKRSEKAIKQRKILFTLKTVGF
jgi:hypothetical protein